MKATSGLGDKSDFWDAIAFSAGLVDAENLDDIGRYVVSRGDGFIGKFESDLESVLSALRDGPVGAEVASSGRTVDGSLCGALGPAEFDRCLQALVLTGRNWCEKVLEHPELARSLTLPVVDISGSIRIVVSRGLKFDAPLWPVLPGDSLKDGSPWIRGQVGLGVGVGGDSDALADPRFLPQFVKGALIASREDSWRAVRRKLGAKSLELWIEYIPDFEEERAIVARRGKKSDVAVYRYGSRTRGMAVSRRLVAEEFDAILEILQKLV